MKRISNVLWGLTFIAIGLVWALNALGVTDVNLFFSGWWTLFIIIPCGIGLVTEREKTANLIGLAIGVLLFASANGVVRSATLFRLAVPVILICIGLSFIFKDMVGKKIANRIKELNKDGLEEYNATFGGQTIDIGNEEFKGASINAVFGGVDFNLMNARMEKDQIINANAIFGGIDIYAPAGVKVKVKSTSIFGGVGNKAKSKTEDELPILYVNAFCLFGGVDIK